MDKKRFWAILPIVLGCLMAAIGVVYAAVPAESLPPFVPGHDPEISKTHSTRAIACIAISVTFFIMSWIVRQGTEAE